MYCCNEWYRTCIVKKDTVTILFDLLFAMLKILSVCHVDKSPLNAEAPANTVTSKIMKVISDHMNGTKKDTKKEHSLHVLA